MSCRTGLCLVICVAALESLSANQPAKPAPKATPKAAAPAPVAAPGAPQPPTKLSEAAVKAYAKAFPLVYQKKSQTDEFAALLRGVVKDIPKLQLSTEPDQAVWNHREINPAPVRFAAYRFTSPLKQPADMYWIISSNYANSYLNWAILPVKGKMEGLKEVKRVLFPKFLGNSFPLHDAAIFQSLTGGQIKPGQEYIAWFAVSNVLGDPTAGIPVSIALRLVPANKKGAREDAPGIADRVGAPLYCSPEGSILCETDQRAYTSPVAPDGKFVAVCDSSKKIRLWDLETKKVTRELVGDEGYYRAVISSDGKRLAAHAGKSLSVALWDLTSGKRLDNVNFPLTKNVAHQLATYTGWHEESILGLSFADGSSFLSAQLQASTQTKGMHWHEVVLWDLSAKKEAHRNSFGDDTRDGLLTPDGRNLLITRVRKVVPPPDKKDVSYEVAILDSKTDQVLGTIPLLPGNTFQKLTLSPDGKMAGIQGSFATFQIIDVSKRAVAATVPTMVEGRQMSQVAVHAIAWSPDSRTLALAFSDNSVQLWDLRESRLRAILRGHTAEIRTLEFTPDSKRLLSAGLDGTVRIWTLDSPVRDVLTDSLGIRLVPLPAADFIMGVQPAAESGEREPHDHERPLHRVHFSRPFYMGQYEVTVKQFRSFVEAAKYKTTAESNGIGGSHLLDPRVGFVSKPEYTWKTPGFAQTDDHPVVQVSWDDAKAFCVWLSKREGAIYRLPTEAEWEYAACSGQDSVNFNKRSLGPLLLPQDLFGNVADISFKKQLGNVMAGDHDDGYSWTAPVGKLNVNAFGLHDMFGNVFEWCADWYDPGYYRVSPGVDPPGPASGSTGVQRGGGWSHPGIASLATRRDYGPPNQTQSSLGFRVVREIPRTKP